MYSFVMQGITLKYSVRSLVLCGYLIACLPRHLYAYPEIHYQNEDGSTKALGNQNSAKQTVFYKYANSVGID